MNVFLYSDIAGNYDSYYQTPAGKKIDEIEKEAVAGFLSQVPKQHILELGCGTGHWSEFLSELGYIITATDISDAMLEVAKQKNLTNVSFQKADAEHLPFGNETFGTVVSITMLEFTANPDNVIREIYRILKPGGVFILGCLNKRSEPGKAKDNDETFRQANFFTKEEIMDMLSVIGKPVMKECVYLTSSFELLDGMMEQYPVEGAFLAFSVTKEK